MKCVLSVTGVEDKEAYVMKKLRGGMEAMIEGGIHVLRLLRQQHDQEEDWGFLLIDVHHALNRENCTSMLWEVRHEWLSGARFAFN